MSFSNKYEWEKFHVYLIHEWPSFIDLGQNFFATTILETLIQSSVLISIFHSKIFPEDIQSIFYARFSTNTFNISILFQSILLQSIVTFGNCNFCHFLIQWINSKQQFKSVLSSIFWVNCDMVVLSINYHRYHFINRI